MRTGERQQVIGVKLGRGRAKTAYIEPVDQVLHRLRQFHGLRRPKPRHQAKQCHGLNAIGAKIAQCQHAQTLGQLFALGTGEQRVVGEIGRSAAHGLHDLNLRGGVGHMVSPAHDVGHTHVDVINGRGKGI